jgi:hypothetical protein
MDWGLGFSSPPLRYPCHICTRTSFTRFFTGKLEPNSKHFLLQVQIVTFLGVSYHSHSVSLSQSVSHTVTPVTAQMAIRQNAIMGPRADASSLATGLCARCLRGNMFSGAFASALTNSSSICDQACPVDQARTRIF